MQVLQQCCIAGLLATGLAGAPALRADDGLPPVERGLQAPTMARFYSLDASGESRREELRAPVLAAESKSGVHRPVRSRPDSVTKARRGTRRIKVIVGGPEQAGTPAPDTLAAWRCERAVFYYTRDGRCVAPAWGRVSRR